MPLQGSPRAQSSEVIVLGRRGPAQAAFTNPELRELGELTRCDVVVEPSEVELDATTPPRGSRSGTSRAIARNGQILKRVRRAAADRQTHQIELRFCRSPVRVVGDGDPRPVSGLRVVRNRIEPDAHGNLRAVPAGAQEVIECGLVCARSATAAARCPESHSTRPRRDPKRRRPG